MPADTLFWEPMKNKCQRPYTLTLCVPKPVCWMGGSCYLAALEGCLEPQPTQGFSLSSLSGDGTLSTGGTMALCTICLGSVLVSYYLSQGNHWKLPFSLKNVSLRLMNYMATQLIRKLEKVAFFHYAIKTIARWGMEYLRLKHTWSKMKERWLIIACFKIFFNSHAV